MADLVAEIRAAITAQGERRVREQYSERVQQLVAAYGRRRGVKAWAGGASRLRWG